MTTWQPGDFLYSMASGCQGEMISIRPDIEDHTMCCQEVEWVGSSDSMHWSPEPPNPIVHRCQYCLEDHGAECPSIDRHYLTLINYYGSENIYDVIVARPGARVPKRLRPGHHQDADELVDAMRSDPDPAP